MLDVAQSCHSYDPVHIVSPQRAGSACNNLIPQILTTRLCSRRYQGSIDWRNPVEWDCNANESPYKEMHNDGISLDPLETLFVKVREESAWATVCRLHHQQPWCRLQGAYSQSKMTLGEGGLTLLC